MKQIQRIIKIIVVLMIIFGLNGKSALSQNEKFILTTINEFNCNTSSFKTNKSPNKTVSNSYNKLEKKNSVQKMQLNTAQVLESINSKNQIIIKDPAKGNTSIASGGTTIKSSNNITVESVSATYNSGHISTDFGFQSLPGQSSCPGTLTLSIPSGAAITGVDVSYTMTSRNWGWKSEQRSQLRCISPGGIAEPGLSQGVGNNTGTHSYSRNGLTIANGVTGGGNIIFQLHAGRTWGGSGCNTTYNRVDNNSWTITLYYTLDPVPDFTVNTLNASIGQTVIFTDKSAGPISSWVWDFGEGAFPLTANTQGPHEIVYSTLGTKTISLTVNGTVTETKTDYITVDNWLHWDNGSNFSAVGVNSAATYQIAARFEPLDISNFISHQITRVRVYIRDLPNSSTLKIWQGTNQNNLVEQVSQIFTPVANSWVVVELNQPYLVDPSRELWFGIEYSDPGSGVFPAGIDELTEHDGKGNLVRLDIGDPNGWTPLSTYTIEGEWNLQAYLIPVAVVWTGNVSSDWDVGNNWSIFSLPQSNSDVTIPVSPNNPIISTDVTINNLVIESGSSLTINPQASLSVTGSLINNAGATGLIISSSSSGTGSLISENDNIPATFQRFVAGIPEAWHLLSSPMSNESISGEFTPSGTYADGTGYDFYTWFEPDTSWVYLLNSWHSPTWAEAHPGNNFIPAKGYLVAYQQSNPTLNFTGNLNNGEVSIEVKKTAGTGIEFGTNLIGNPYPSSIDWKSTSGWDRTDMEISGGGYNIYIWNDVSYNYGVYNSASTSDEGTLGVTRYIAPTQGFFIRASQNGSISMSNQVRVHQGASNWLKGISHIKELLHVVVNSEEGYGSDEVLIEFNPDFYEKGTPKKFSFVSNAPSLYIPGKGQFYSYQALEDVITHPVIPISFKAGASGQYSIRVNFDDVFFEMLDLIDLQNGHRQDLKENPVYRFQGSNKDETGRFVLQLQPGHYADPHNKLPARIYSYGAQLYVDMQLLKGDYTLAVYELSGRLAISKILQGGSIHTLLFPGSGLYHVRLIGNQGSITKKVFGN